VASMQQMCWCLLVALALGKLRTHSQQICLLGQPISSSHQPSSPATCRAVHVHNPLLRLLRYLAPHLAPGLCLPITFTAGLLELHLLPTISAQLDAFLNSKLPGQTAAADFQGPLSQHPAAAEPQLPNNSAAAAANQGSAASTSPVQAADAEGEATASTNPTLAAADAGDRQGPRTGSRPYPAPERVVEICCGILANLYSTPAAVPMLVSCTDLTQSLAVLMLGVTDPPVLSELCRLLTAALSCPEVRDSSSPTSFLTKACMPPCIYLWTQPVVMMVM
jgi:hypothetical protein